MKNIESEQVKTVLAEAQKAFWGEADRLGLEDIDDVVTMIKGFREEKASRKNIAELFEGYNEEYVADEIDWGDSVGKEQC